MKCDFELGYDITNNILMVFKYGEIVDTIEDVELDDETIEELKVEVNSPYWFGLWDDGELIDVYSSDIANLIDEYDLDMYFN